MQTVIKSIDRTITAEDIIPLLNKYGMLSRLAYEDIIDRAIAGIECTSQEIAIASKLWQHQQNKSPNASSNIASAIRKLKIEKFKQNTWGDSIPAYFASRKKQLDRVTYSVIKTKQKEVIREVHFRLIEQEQSFTELSAEFATECSVNPIEVSQAINSELGTLPGPIAQQLSTMKANTFSAPLLVGNYYLILRLDRYVSATCDRPMQKRLLDELFDRWMQQQLAHQKYHLENHSFLQ